MRASDRLNRARREAHLEITDVAARSGHPAEVIRYSERGDVIPHGEVLLDLLEVIGMRPSTLLARRRRTLVGDLKGNYDEVYVVGAVASGTDTPSDPLELLIRFSPGDSDEDVQQVEEHIEDVVGVEVIVRRLDQLTKSIPDYANLESEARPLFISAPVGSPSGPAGAHGRPAFGSGVVWRAGAAARALA